MLQRSSQSVPVPAPTKYLMNPSRSPSSSPSPRSKSRHKARVEDESPASNQPDTGKDTDTNPETEYPVANSYGEILLAQGTLFLTGPVTQRNIAHIIEALMTYPHLVDPPETISLFINSVGGDAFAAYHLIDLMKLSPIPVATFGHGCVASAGLMLLMAGTKGYRHITENTYLMSHTYSTGIEGKEYELYDSVRDFELQTEKMVRHYVKCLGKNSSYVRKHLLNKSDVHLSPEDAKRHGICDHVISVY
jgi:ATP-dependent Clp protease, protease subunit